MASYKHYIPPARRVESTANTFMAGRLRHPSKSRGKAAVADWEDEGGSTVAPVVAKPSA